MYDGKVVAMYVGALFGGAAIGAATNNLGLGVMFSYALVGIVVTLWLVLDLIDAWLREKYGNPQ